MNRGSSPERLLLENTLFIRVRKMVVVTHGVKKINK